jgi:hypothetical protein
MNQAVIWIEGSSRSGKTRCLVDIASAWLQEPRKVNDGKLLVLAGNDESKRWMGEEIALNTNGQYPIVAKTPIGFIQEEVFLYYPLLQTSLNLPPQFPLRLRPETEQELATELWQPVFERENWRALASSEYRFVRRVLDLVQLAASSGSAMESIPEILIAGAEGAGELLDAYSWLGSLTSEWRDWCLERGLLTYGIMTALYWRYLMPHPTYRSHLERRFWGIIADDVDDYPAIIRDTLAWSIDRGKRAALSFNPDGMVRLGLNADPDYWWQFRAQATRVIDLDTTPTNLFQDSAYSVREIVAAVAEPSNFVTLPPNIQTIVDRTRGELLRLATQEAIERIQAGDIKPHELAILAPGLDAIARYTITDLFDRANIPISALNEQRPLNSDPNVRALLTLLALIYPHLGQLVDRDEVADLLVSLSPIYPPQSSILTEIDPVRAGLLSDYCFAPRMSQPELLPIDRFPRWDRLGAATAKAYERIITWIDRARQQQELPLKLLDQAIDFFFASGSHLPFDRLSSLRELMETAQHYWQVAERTANPTEFHPAHHQIVGRFIHMLRRGTVSANPYPLRALQPQTSAVTLSNIFQYRASKQHHRWHMWLDVGSPLWAQGGAATLYGANLFLQDRIGTVWTEADTELADSQRLARIVSDLLQRVDDRLYLCHSDLSIDGQTQTGALLNLLATGRI